MQDIWTPIDEGLSQEICLAKKALDDTRDQLKQANAKIANHVINDFKKLKGETVFIHAKYPLSVSEVWLMLDLESNPPKMILADGDTVSMNHEAFLNSEKYRLISMVGISKVDSIDHENGCCIVELTIPNRQYGSRWFDHSLFRTCERVVGHLIPELLKVLTHNQADWYLEGKYKVNYFPVSKFPSDGLCLVVEFRMLNTYEEEIIIGMIIPGITGDIKYTELIDLISEFKRISYVHIGDPEKDYKEGDPEKDFCEVIIPSNVNKESTFKLLMDSQLKDSLKEQARKWNQNRQQGKSNPEGPWSMGRFPGAFKGAV